MPELEAVGEQQRCEDHADREGAELGCDQYATAVEAVGDHARDDAERELRQRAHRHHAAEVRRGLGQLVDKHGARDLLRP